MRSHRRQVNIGCVLMGSCLDVYMGVRVCVTLGWYDIICSRDAIQVVSARDMVRLAPCICTMSALFRNIQGSHSSPLHCDVLCTSACVNMPCLSAFILITAAFPFFVAPSHGFGYVYVAFPRFGSAIMLASALWLFI